MTRAAAVTPTAPVLVSNIGQATNGSVNVGHFSGFQNRIAQKFTTGSNSGGYILNDVIISLKSVGADAEPVITIRAANSSGDDPVNTVLHPLTTPATVADGNITFGAPSGAMLDSDTSYFVVMANTNTADLFVGRYGINGATVDDEDAGVGLVDWSIADVGRQEFSAGWSDAGNSLAFKIQLRGSERTASTDATLGALTVIGASNRTLDPAFAPGHVRLRVIGREQGGQDHHRADVGRQQCDGRVPR